MSDQIRSLSRKFRITAYPRLCCYCCCRAWQGWNDAAISSVMDAIISWRLNVKGRVIYIPPLTRKPWPGAVYNAKWRTDRQWHWAGPSNESDVVDNGYIRRFSWLRLRKLRIYGKQYDCNPLLACSWLQSEWPWMTLRAILCQNPFSASISWIRAFECQK